MDNLKTTGLYVCGYSATHKPIEDRPFYVVVQKYIISNQNVIRQIAGRSDTIGVYERWFSDNSWGSWKILQYDIPSFYKNYNDLSSLASGLGVLSGFPTYIDTANYDLNDAPHGYIAIGHTAKTTVVNNPFNHEVAGVITIRKNIAGVGDIRLQIAYRDNRVKMRCYWVGTWGEWKDVI